MLFVADVLNLGVSAADLVLGEAVASVRSADGDVGDRLLAADFTVGLIAAGLLVLRSRLVSNLAVVGVGDLTPRLMGGGVAPSASSESSEPAVVGDDCVVSASLCVAVEVPGLEPT